MSPSKFLGPLPSGEYLLVIVDYFSRYKEIEIMKRITAEETTCRLHTIFTRLGYPVTITLDNARQFISTHFDAYCKLHGIQLNYSTPYWPQENGLVERQNRSLLKRLQISHATGRNWKEDLNDYLMMYYTSPHATTGKTPTELCYGRTIRLKIPSITDIESTPNMDDVRERDHLLKQKGKESEDRKRRAKESDLQVGDSVLMKNLLPGNKLTPTFDPSEYLIVNKEGPRVTWQNKVSNKFYERNVTHVKRIPPAEPEEPSHQELSPDDPSLARDAHAELMSSPPVEDSQTPNVYRSRRNVKPPAKYRDYVVSRTESN